jgi:hypothetical protein
MQRICGGRYKTQVAGCRLQVGNCAGWNFAGWGFCRLEFCRLPGILQVDNANLKLHHFFSILVWLSCAFIAVWLLVGAFDISLSCCHVPSLCTKASGHHPRENIQNDQIGLDLQGDECFDCCVVPTWRGGVYTRMLLFFFFFIIFFIRFAN